MFVWKFCTKISIHALREEGDRNMSRLFKDLFDFYPRPPRGGRLPVTADEVIHLLFLSTPSARRATIYPVVVDFVLIISIHALREEGDAASAPRMAEEMEFLSTPSARRATFCTSG